MPQYSAGQCKLESGVLYSSSMQPLSRVTNVKVDFNVPRTNVMVLNRGKPLEQRPVINYIPVDVSIDMIHADNSLETMLGLTNQNNITTNITDTAAATATYGIRSMQVYYAPTSSSNYNSLLDIKSGVLTNYSLQGTISEAMRKTFSMQFLDMSGSVNLTARDSTNIAASLIKPENVSLTGIQFTGYGLTGFIVQSFSLGITFGRASVMQLGSRFPASRPLTDVTASLQVQGFVEGLNNTITGLGTFNCGTPTYGTVGLTMTPACSTSSPITITAINPYLDSYSIDGQVGNFTTVALSFSLPLGPNPNETGDGSVLLMT